MESPRVLLRRHRKGSQESNCLKIIEHIGQIWMGLSCSSEFPKLSHNLPIVCFVVSCFNLGAMKSYVLIFVLGFVC